YGSVKSRKIGVVACVSARAPAEPVATPRAATLPSSARRVMRLSVISGPSLTKIRHARVRVATAQCIQALRPERHVKAQVFSCREAFNKSADVRRDRGVIPARRSEDLAVASLFSV